jgi:hypothetical protein
MIPPREACFGDIGYATVDDHACIEDLERAASSAVAENPTSAERSR